MAGNRKPETCFIWKRKLIYIYTTYRTYSEFLIVLSDFMFPWVLVSGSVALKMRVLMLELLY